MSIFFLSVLALAQAPPQPPITVGPPSVVLARFNYPVDGNEVLETAENCGFETARLSDNPTYRDLRAEKSDFSDEKLSCLKQWIAMRPELAIEIPPPAPVETARRELVASARKNLEERSLLAGAPTLESTGSLEALAPAMEKHCGFAAGSIIKVEGDWLSFDPDDADKYSNFDKVTCLLAVLALSGVSKFGFVGNEKVPEGQEPVDE